MADTIDKATRSAVMARVRSKDTGPELRLRRALFAHGFRYRLHNHKLPGTPDLALAKYGAVIFVHGCLWHWHGCRRSRMPATNAEYWKAKIERNCARDRKSIRQLGEHRLRILVVWECALAPRLVDETASIAARWLRECKSPGVWCIEPIVAVESTIPSSRLREVHPPTDDL